MIVANSFLELKECLDAYPNQVDGVAAEVSDAGEKYVEFLESALARPGDVSIVEQLVVRHMAYRLDIYLSSRLGRIYWRVRLEWKTSAYDLLANGFRPDDDDKEWKLVGCYCRLYRASLPALPVKPLDQVP